MGKKFSKRVVALVLALSFMIAGGTTVSAGAQSTASNSSITDKSIQDIKEQLNTQSYEDYIAATSDVKKGTGTFVIDATKNWSFVTSSGVVIPMDQVTDSSSVAHLEEYDGYKALYSPADGTVVWTLDAAELGLTEAAKYSISIEYYPVEGKPTSAERVFRINGEVPFGEARNITFSKVWRNLYADSSFKVEKDKKAEDYLAAAKKIGIEASTKTDEKGDVYIVYEMPEVWTSDISNLTDEYSLHFFKTDIDNNELRPTMVQTPEWRHCLIKDVEGYYSDAFEFVISPDEDGKISLSLQGVNEPVAIKSITITQQKAIRDYEAYKNSCNGASSGSDKFKIEAELMDAASSKTIYPVEDRNSALTSPCDTSRTVLNTFGGEKWATAGQWVTYKFKVSESGMYSIVTRFKQSALDGLFVSRTLSIHSEGAEEGSLGYYDGVPFAEAARLQFGYSGDWQVSKLGDGKNDFEFYFEKDVVYTVTLEVAMGDMGDIVRRVENVLDSINSDYLNIMKLTGASPDQYRSYGFFRIMPDTIKDLRDQSKELYAIAKEFKSIAGSSSNTATLENIAWLLHRMGTDEDQIAVNLEQLKSHIGTLGTWLGDAKKQPLQLDYLMIQSADAELPRANANFFEALIHEIVSFFMSFFRNYDRMGATASDGSNSESIEVWLATGRDQTQVIRTMINNNFTPNSKNGTTVTLKLVVKDTLLPSILSGSGPDVYIGLAQSDVINYAIRGALIPIEDMPDYEKTIKDFNESAMMVLGIEDSLGDYHVYGLPETQNFPMMFIRTDILADLNLEIPKTWDEVLELIPDLMANNMEIGLNPDYKIYLYQLGGELYADNGMRINLDSNVALNSFEMMCNMITMYSLPYKYDAANRFRTGEMPILISTAYTDTYNQLKVFATEIEGSWTFVPLPGIKDEKGNINNASVSTVTSVSMISGCEKKEAAWEFMQWFVSADTQSEYANEMAAILGPSAKYATANIDALENLPWTTSELAEIRKQFNNLASIPNYPGSYILDRYTKFAFLDAYNNKADPVDSLLGYINIINEEITRKRQEFDLETLEIGQTLASKRIDQIIAELDQISKDSGLASKYAALIEQTKDVLEMAVTNEESIGLRENAALWNGSADSARFQTIVKYLNDAANAYDSYTYN